MKKRADKGSSQMNNLKKIRISIGSWVAKVLINALNKLVECGVHVTLKYVVLKENYRELYKAKEFASKYSLELMTSFGISSASNGDSFPLSHRVTAQEAFEFDCRDPKRRNFWLSKAHSLMLEKTGLQNEHEYKRQKEGYLYPCDIAWHSVFINHLGQMMGCVKSSYISYDLLNGDFDEGWDFLHKKLREPKKSNLKCNSCKAFHYCEQCTANFLTEESGTLEIDGFYCEIAFQRKKMVEREAEKIMNRGSHD